MVSLPLPVQKTLLQMKKEYDHYVEVKVIDNLFCVFESTGVYDRSTKKTKKITKYLGIIRLDGTFAPAKHSLPKIEKTNQQQEAPKIEISEENRKILMALSMNGRITYDKLSKSSGISKSSIYNRVKSLEETYSIRYTAEISTDALGYLKFLFFIKFKDKIPPISQVRGILNAEPNIQLAFSLKGGEYDMMFYVLAESNYDVNRINVLLRRETLFVDYPAEWYITPSYQSNGYIPLRDKFIETLKSKDKSNNAILISENYSSKRAGMLRREFLVLKEINSNGTVNFKDIDAKYGFDQGRAHYTYHSLLKKGVFERITLSMEKLPIHFLALFTVKIIDYKKFERSRASFLKSLIEYTNPITNKYAVMTDIGIPYAALLFLPAFSYEDLEKAEVELMKIDGVAVKYSMVSQIILGNLCYRLFDNNYSDQKRFLVERYKYQPETKIEY